MAVNLAIEGRPEGRAAVIDADEHWNLSDSEAFIAYGDCFVPERAEQLDVVCSALPKFEDPTTIVDLGCGYGRLSGALLERFPRTRVVGIDAAQEMLDAAGHRLAAHGDRFEPYRADIADIKDGDWWRDGPLDAVVSMLAVHHLKGEHKRELFAGVLAALRPGGSLVVADLVAPASDRGVELARRAWDEAVERASLQLYGDRQAHEAFRRLRWNLYDDMFGDPIDHPSRIIEQLQWLVQTGYADVDVYWMNAGHAIFGGNKPVSASR